MNLLKRKIEVILVGLAVVTGSTAFGQDLNWQTLRIGGEGRAAICNESTVLPFFNGDVASFIFTSLGVDLPAQDYSHQKEFGACRIRARFTIPQGFALTGIEQNVSGGAIKSRGARGFFRSRIFLRLPPDQRGIDAPLFPVDRRTDPDALGQVAGAEKVFRPVDEGGGDILTISSNVQFGPGRRQYLCNATRNRPVSVDAIWRVSVMGQRTRANQNILIQVDSVDNRFDVGLRIESCR